MTDQSTYDLEHDSLERRILALWDTSATTDPIPVDRIATLLGLAPEALDAEIEVLVRRGRLTRRMGPDGTTTYAPTFRGQRLGEMLVQAGLITPARLKEALAVQAQTGDRLGQVLVARGYISKQSLGEALGAQRGFPYVNLSVQTIDEDVLRSLPEWVIHQYKVLPFARVNAEVHLAMIDPQDIVALDTVTAFLGARARPFLTTEIDLDWALTKFFGVSRKVDQSVVELEPEDVAQRKVGSVTITESHDSPPIVRVLNSIISDAVRTSATDIHIEPGVDEARVRFRIDGLLYDKVVLPSGVAEAVGSRLKVLSGMDIAERVASQDGRVLLNLNGHEFDLRIATVGTAFGERVAIRLLNPQRLLLGLDRLGLFPEQEKIFTRVLSRPYGMVLVTGPTGSGKTTTLYAALSLLNERSRNIMTIEDPVEYRLEGITQIPVREKMRVTFGMGLRAILRHDPDVVMVGEIRDPETASIALQAALTGHLVLSTLHTNNAAGALVRLMEMGSQPYLLTSSVLAVVGQRLIRVLCPTCKQRTRASEADLKLLGISPSEGLFFYQPVGCPDCDHLGYKGRTGVFEIMVMTDGLREIVLERKPEAAMMRVAQGEGMASLQDSAVRAVLEGTTSIDVLRQLIVGQIG